MPENIVNSSEERLIKFTERVESLKKLREPVKAPNHEQVETNSLQAKTGDNSALAN